MRNKFKVTYHNRYNSFVRYFTKEQIKDNIHLDEICDSPTLRDYKIKSIERV